MMQYRAENSTAGSQTVGLAQVKCPTEPVLDISDVSTRYNLGIKVTNNKSDCGEVYDIPHFQYTRDFEVIRMQMFLFDNMLSAESKAPEKSSIGLRHAMQGP